MSGQSKYLLAIALTLAIAVIVFIAVVGMIANKLARHRNMKSEVVSDYFTNQITATTNTHVWTCTNCGHSHTWFSVFSESGGGGWSRTK